MNTQRMTLFMLEYKRIQLLGLLEIWLQKSDFDLFECAEMFGHLGSATTTSRWGRVLFFGLQNLMRKHLVAQYHAHICGNKARRIAQALLPSLAKRFDSLIAREVAALLWRSKKRFSITNHFTAELQYLHTYLTDPLNP